MVDYVIQNGKITPKSSTPSNVKPINSGGGDTLTIVEESTGKVVRQGSSVGSTGLPSVTGNGNIPSGTITYTPAENEVKQTVGMGISTITGQADFLKEPKSGIVNIDSNKSSVVGLNPDAKQIKDNPNEVQVGVITGLTAGINLQRVLPFSISKEGQGYVDFGKVFGTKDYSQTLRDIPQTGQSITRKMSVEQRETVTNLGLVGGGLATAGAAPVIGGLAGTVAGTLGFVSTAIGTPGVTKAVVRSGSQAVSPQSIDFSFEEQRSRAAVGFNAQAETLGKRNVLASFTNPFDTTQQVNISADSIAYGLIPGAGMLGDNKETFVNAVTEVGIAKGESPSVARRKAEQIYAIEGMGGGAGEIAALVPGGIVGEYFGQKTVQGAISKSNISKMSTLEAGKAVEKIARTRLGIAGAIEAPTLYTAQSLARNQPVTPEGLAISAVTGGFGAGVIGGKIAKWGYTNPNVASAAVNVVRLVNPDESFGDFGYTVGGLGKTRIKAPVLTLTATDSLTGLNTKSIYNNSSLSFSPSQTPSNSLSTTKTSIYSPTFDPTVTFTPTFTPTLTPSPSPTPTGTITFTPTEIFTPTITPTETTTPTPTQTFTPTLTPTFTPTVTLPFIPFGGLPGMNGEAFGGGGISRGRRKYYDEWESALGILNRQQPEYVTRANKVRAKQQNKLMRAELKKYKAKRPVQGKLFIPKGVMRGFL